MPITMYRGDSRIINIAIKNIDGDPVDVSNANKIIFGVFPGIGAELLKTLDDGISVVTDIVTITLVPADTISLSTGTYTIELEITLADGTVSTALQDQLFLKRDYVT